jgi:topoisomerase IA-like protein
MTKEKAIHLLEHENENGKNMIRYLTPELSIKKGRYGAYIFHKTEHMKKPAFYPIKKFPLQYTLCDKEVLIGWIKTTYNITVEM